MVDDEARLLTLPLPVFIFGCLSNLWICLCRTAKALKKCVSIKIKWMACSCNFKLVEKRYCACLAFSGGLYLLVCIASSPVCRNHSVEEVFCLQLWKERLELLWSAQESRAWLLVAFTLGVCRCHLWPRDPQQGSCPMMRVGLPRYLLVAPSGGFHLQSWRWCSSQGWSSHAAKVGAQLVPCWQAGA